LLHLECFFLGGKVASILLLLFGGTGYVNHPSNLVQWIEYAKKMKSVPENIQKIIFKKELVFFTLPWIVIITIYVVRKCELTRLDSVYVGIPGGVLVNYVLTLPYINRLSQKLEEAKDSEVDSQEDIEGATKSHDRSLTKYSITVLTTTMIMLLALTLYDRSNVFNPIIDGFISWPASIAGFILGILIFKFYTVVAEYCFSQRARRSSSVDLSQPLL